MVSLHVFNARVCALCVRTPHFCDVKVPFVFNAFSAFPFRLVLCFFHLMSCSLQHTHTHARKEAFDIWMQGILKWCGRRLAVRRYVASSTLSFSYGEWHTVRVSGLFGGSLLGV